MRGGDATVGGAMQPPPEGVWGMPPDMLKSLPGYDPDVQKNRTEARAIMENSATGRETGSTSNSRRGTSRFFAIRR